MNKRFVIIGAGMGDAQQLTGEAVREIQQATQVLATERFAQSLAGLRGDIIACTFGEMATRAIQAQAACVALLVSGDAGFFSAASALYQALEQQGERCIIAGVSSMQYFCAKLGVRYDDAVVRSLHGRQGSLLGAVSYHHKVFALTGGQHTASGICRDLTSAGLGGVCVSLGTYLGSAQERIVQGTAAMLADDDMGDALAVLLIENDQAVQAHIPVCDTMLTRGDVPMTKEEVRWVCAAKLAVCPQDIVWDIGAGTGSVSIELARKASDGMVYAIERKAEAVALLCRNRHALGAFNIHVVEGLAPDALEGLPTPDAVFIGGSAGNMAQLLSNIKQRNANVRVVVTAIALETVGQTLTALRQQGFAHVSVVQLSTARTKEVGAYSMLTGMNPIFILSGGCA